MKYEILFKEMKNGRTVIDEITRSVIGAAETRPEMADHECVAEVGLDNAFDGVDDDLPFDEESNGVFESWALHVAQWAVEHVPSENRPVSNRDPRLPPPGTRMQIPGVQGRAQGEARGPARAGASRRLLRARGPRRARDGRLVERPR